MKYGYARVSSQDQNLARQLQRLKEVGMDRIYEEKISGAINERPELMKVLKHLKPGDELYVIEMERLGRNNEYLTHIFMEVYLKGAKLVILDLPTFDDIDDANMRNFLRNIFIETRNSKQSRKESEFEFDNVRESNWPKSEGFIKDVQFFLDQMLKMKRDEKHILKSLKC